jgi:hypothetical protein
MAREPRPGGISRQMSLLAAEVARAGAERFVRAPEAAARLVRWAGAKGARPVMIVGDSHGRLYVHRARRAGEWLLPLHYLATGASARGLGRATSRSGQGETILKMIANLRASGIDAPVLLVFGQVDIEFVFMFKRLASDPPASLDAEALRVFSAETAEALAAFGAQLAEYTDGPIHLATIFPPALSDDAWRQGYVNAHIANDHASLPLNVLRERLARTEIRTLAVRTQDHASFSEQVKTAAQGHGLKVLDVAGALPMQDGSMSPHLLGAAAGADHHLDFESVRPFIVPLLWSVVQADSGRD